MAEVLLGAGSGAMSVGSAMTARGDLFALSDWAATQTAFGGQIEREVGWTKLFVIPLAIKERPCYSLRLH